MIQEDRTIEATLSGVRLGPARAWRGLHLIPLVGADAPAAEYVTLDEALAAGWARVTEVSEAGRVPELRLVNDGPAPLLVADGEELVGAKQNRIVNLSILAAAKSALTIPVSCVEVGRWSSRSERMGAAPRVHYAAGRARKMRDVTAALRLFEERRSDQAAIWRDIEEKAARLGARSATGAAEAMYVSHDAALAEAVEVLAPVEGQRGAVVAIAGRIVALELFDRAATFRKLWPKLARSYALDALDADAEWRLRGEAPAKDAGCGNMAVDHPPADDGALRAEAEAFLWQVAGAPATRFPAVGLGEDLRLESGRVAGAALVADGHVLHLLAFAIDGRQSDGTVGHHIDSVE